MVQLLSWIPGAPISQGKPIGDGHPIGAVITTPAIAAKFAAKFSYFNTFGGNPVSAAVGMAVLDVLEREGIQQNVIAAGKVLEAGLAKLAKEYPLVADSATAVCNKNNNLVIQYTATAWSSPNLTKRTNPEIHMLVNNVKVNKGAFRRQLG